MGRRRQRRRRRRMAARRWAGSGPGRLQRRVSRQRLSLVSPLRPTPQGSRQPRRSTEPSLFYDKYAISQIVPVTRYSFVRFRSFRVFTLVLRDAHFEIVPCFPPAVKFTIGTRPAPPVDGHHAAALPSRSAALLLQGVRRRYLRARAAAQPLQGLRRRQHMRAWAAAQPLQGVRRRQHLRARAAAQQVQGLRRRQHLRAWAAPQRVQGVRRQPSRRRCHSRGDGGRRKRSGRGGRAR